MEVVFIISNPVAKISQSKYIKDHVYRKDVGIHISEKMFYSNFCDGMVGWLGWAISFKIRLARFSSELKSLSQKSLTLKQSKSSIDS